MRLSQSLLTTQREAPADAETLGTVMLTRAGYLRKIGSGLYAHLPLMNRVLHKLERLIREELDPISQEVSLPLLQPESLWRESGRWEAYTRSEGIMFTVTDRARRQHTLGPTHEEVALDVVRGLVQSYRDLPVNIYQIGRKFRDELRPRFGLLRTREFLMKDAYSFHADPDSLREQFEAMSAAYTRILTRLGAEWRMVEADSGNIGGETSREFMVLAAVGEDEVLYTPDGQYAANAERAVSRATPAGPSPFSGFQTVDTPNTTSVAAACALLGCETAHMVKNVLYDATFWQNNTDGQGGTETLVPVLVSLRGDHSVNPTKLHNAVQERHLGTLTRLELAEPERWAASALPLGYIGPDLPDSVLARQSGLSPRFLRLCDHAAAELRDFATGANKTDQHVTGANWQTNFALPERADLRQAVAGEAAQHDPAQPLQSARGIEVGHVFQLGSKYAAAMGATFTGADGQPKLFQMGSYGIGVSRLAQAVAEQLSDERGLNWPACLAPYTVILTVVDIQNAEQMQAAEQLYGQLWAAGIETLLDDRPLRAGAKFADADLLGIPWRVTLGRGLSSGEVELKARRSGTQQTVRLGEVVAKITEASR